MGGGDQLAGGDGITYAHIRSVTLDIIGFRCPFLALFAGVSFFVRAVCICTCLLSVCFCACSELLFFRTLDSGLPLLRKALLGDICSLGAPATFNTPILPLYLPLFRCADPAEDSERLDTTHGLPTCNPAPDRCAHENNVLNGPHFDYIFVHAL